MNMDHLNFVVEACYYGYWIAVIFGLLCLTMFVTQNFFYGIVRKNECYKKELYKVKRNRCIRTADFCHCMKDVCSDEEFEKWNKREQKWLAMADKFKEIKNDT